MIKGKFLTTPNIISMTRVPLALAAGISLQGGHRLETAVFMVLATLTDAIDGALARKTGTVSDWGKILDPGADKAAFLIMAFALIRAGLMQPWLLWLLLCRDGLIVVGGLFMAKRVRVPSSNIWGKIATLVLALYMIRQAVLPELRSSLGPEVFGTDPLGLLAALLIIVSFATYVFVFLRSNGPTDAP